MGEITIAKVHRCGTVVADNETVCPNCASRFETPRPAMAGWDDAIAAMDLMTARSAESEATNA